MLACWHAGMQRGTLAFILAARQGYSMDTHITEDVAKAVATCLREALALLDQHHGSSMTAIHVSTALDHLADERRRRPDGNPSHGRGAAATPPR